MPRKNFYISEADEKEVYEKAKQYAGESISSVIVDGLRIFVKQQEALQSGMTEQAIYDGVEREDIFQGKTLKFQGRAIAEDAPIGCPDMRIRVFLTKKGKFLVYRVFTEPDGSGIKYWYDPVYEDYFDMKAKAELPNNVISACEEYLNKNSAIRTYEILDV